MKSKLLNPGILAMSASALMRVPFLSAAQKADKQAREAAQKAAEEAARKAAEAAELERQRKAMATVSSGGSTSSADLKYAEEVERRLAEALAAARKKAQSGTGGGGGGSANTSGGDQYYVSQSSSGATIIWKVEKNGNITATTIPKNPGGQYSVTGG